MTPRTAAWAAGLVTCIAVSAPGTATANERDDAHADGASELPAGALDRGAATPALRTPARSRPVPWLVPTAQLQLWFTAWDQDESAQADPAGYGDPEHDVGFTLARARFGFEGGWRMVDFRIRFGTSSPYDALDKASPHLGLVDGWARVRFDSVAGTTSLTLGQHAVPFSREALMSSNDIAFQERSVSSVHLAPLRDVGATLRHDWTHLGAAIGVFNGGGDLFGNDDNGVLLSARLEGHVGGDTYRTNASDPAFGIGAGYIYDKSPVDVTQRVGVDMLGRIGGVTLFVEGGMVIVDPADDPVVRPPDVPEKTTRWGGQATLSYYRETKIGAVEPAVRFAYYDDARHLQDNGDVGILHAGLTWREPVPFMDFGAAYIHRFEFAGREIANDTVRLFVGVRYPSRKYAPLDLVDALRRAGADPLAHGDAAPE